VATDAACAGKNKSLTVPDTANIFNAELHAFVILYCSYSCPCVVGTRPSSMLGLQTYTKIQTYTALM